MVSYCKFSPMRIPRSLMNVDHRGTSIIDDWVEREHIESNDGHFSRFSRVDP